MGLVYIVIQYSPPLLSISFWFLFYISSCRRSFLAGSNLFHCGCSTNSCGFGVPVSGGECRTFLPHHAGQSPGQSFVCLVPCYIPNTRSTPGIQQALRTFVVLNK